MADSQDPQDPFGPLAADAMRLHEFYMSLVRAGFSEAQAVYLIACALNGGPKGTP